MGSAVCAQRQLFAPESCSLREGSCLGWLVCGQCCSGQTSGVNGTRQAFALLRAACRALRATRRAALSAFPFALRLLLGLNAQVEAQGCTFALLRAACRALRAASCAPLRARKRRENSVARRPAAGLATEATCGARFGGGARLSLISVSRGPWCSTCSTHWASVRTGAGLQFAVAGLCTVWVILGSKRPGFQEASSWVGHPGAGGVGH